MEKIIQIGTIRQFIVQNYINDGLRLGFAQAFKKLLPLPESATPPHPQLAQAFLHCDFQNLSYLRQLVDQIPVPTLSVNSAVTDFNLQTSRVMLKALSNIQISLEMPYAPQEFITVDGYLTHLYVLRGHGQLQTPHYTQELLPGKLYFLPADLPYYVDCGTEDFIINLVVKKIFLENLWAPWMLEDATLAKFSDMLRHQKKIFHLTLPNEASTQHYFQRLFYEYVSHVPSALPNFLHALAGLYGDLLANPTNQQRLTTMQATSSLYDILREIKLNYQTTSLEKIARKFNYSPTYLSKLIKSQTGQSFQNLLIAQKIAVAQNLLATRPDLKISDISQKVGYRTPEHFATVFKKHTNQTPSVYRTTIQK